MPLPYATRLAIFWSPFAGGVAFQEWRAWARQRQREEEKAARAQRPRIGSIDDLMADKLRAGDVIAFDRDCAILHTPQASMSTGMP